MALALLPLLLLGQGRERAPVGGVERVEVAALGGRLELSTSRHGRAIVRARGLAPGRVVKGGVAVRSRGARWALLTLSKRRLRDVPGRFGGRLSRGLVLTVEDRTGRRPRVVYRGSLASMPTLRLGRIAAGHPRRFRFSAILPAGPTPASDWSGDNRYQGASVSVEFLWRAVARPRSESAAPPADVLAGTGGDDVIVGTPGDDRIEAGAGDDRVDGRGGDDVIDLGSGNDEGRGGPGNDHIAGGSGHDRLWGDAGDDVVLGESGDDALRGGGGADRVLGGAGVDGLAGGRGRDETRQ